MENVTNSLQWLLPYLAASIALVLFLLNFKGTVKKLWEGDPAAIVLVLVTLLCGAYGTERLFYAAQVNQRLVGIEDRLTRPVGGQLLKNYDQIYRSAASICKTAEKEIRTLAVASDRKSPSYFADQVVERLKQLKQMNRPARYDAVAVLDSAKVQDANSVQNLVQIIDERSQIYEKSNVGDLFHRYIIVSDRPLAFDVVLVDKRHVMYGFTSLKDGPRLDNAILFENQTDMADATADWFERTVFPLAVPYDQWLREQQTKFGDIVLSKRKKADK